MAMELFEWENHTQIPNELFTWLESLTDEKLYQTGQNIYQEGDFAPQFYYLKKGKVKVFATSEDGVEKTLAIYENKNIFGEAAFFDGLSRMSSARTMMDSKIITIDREKILSCFRESPSLALAMLSSLSRLVRTLSSQINQISFLPNKKRLAAFLLEESLKSGNQIRYTQEEIASMIGCSRITVNRILGEFKQKHWISTKYGILMLLPEGEEKLSDV